MADHKDELLAAARKAARQGLCPLFELPRGRGRPRLRRPDLQRLQRGKRLPGADLLRRAQRHLRHGRRRRAGDPGGSGHRRYRGVPPPLRRLPAGHRRVRPVLEVVVHMCNRAGDSRDATVAELVPFVFRLKKGVVAQGPGGTE